MRSIVHSGILPRVLHFNIFGDFFLKCDGISSFQSAGWVCVWLWAGLWVFATNRHIWGSLFPGIRSWACSNPGAESTWRKAWAKYTRPTCQTTRHVITWRFITWLWLNVDIFWYTVASIIWRSAVRSKCYGSSSASGCPRIGGVHWLSPMPKLWKRLLSPGKE